MDEVISQEALLFSDLGKLRKGIRDISADIEQD
jgi:hypothetical protein